MNNPFPFSAIVGQEEMKQAMIFTSIDPSIGGVLVFGDRGTGKSTAVRALAGLLPPIRVVKSCPVNSFQFEDCPDWANITDRAMIEAPTPVVDLPLGASEDRVKGALDIEKALTRGEKAFQPGLLAKANRGYLYIDEVNLLEDHIVDLLLDVAQSGENVIEREGLSIRPRGLSLSAPAIPKKESCVRSCSTGLVCRSMWPHPQTSTNGSK